MQARFEDQEKPDIVHKKQDDLKKPEDEEKDDPKKIAKFRDGSKLEALIEVHQKIKKAFKRKTFNVLPDDKLVSEAKKYSDTIKRNQMKGFGAIWNLLLPLLPLYIAGLVFVAWDAYIGPAMFAKTFGMLDGVANKTMSVDELKYMIIQVNTKSVFYATVSTYGAKREVTLNSCFLLADVSDLDSQHWSRQARSCTDLQMRVSVLHEGGPSQTFMLYAVYLHACKHLSLNLIYGCRCAVPCSRGLPDRTPNISTSIPLEHCRRGLTTTRRHWARIC